MPTATKKKPKKKTAKKHVSNPAADPAIHGINDALKIIGKSEWKEKYVLTNDIWINPKWKADRQYHTEVELLVVSPKATGVITNRGSKDATKRLSLVMFSVGSSLFLSYAIYSIEFGYQLTDRPLLVVDTLDPSSMVTLTEKLLPLGLRLQAL